MKFTGVLSALSLLSSAVLAETESQSTEAISVPSEAIIGYLDLDGANDVAIIPLVNTTDSGLLFVNTTIYEQASNEDNVSLKKREADADAWHWLSIAPGQPMYIKRDANADADAEAWHWLSISPGQPMYIKRDANADADAEAWHWLSIAPGQPMYI
ncbi:hypothetical protein KAFR_0B06780 [Kazachstania africana CBS 2517]|uniref:Mating factor alpha n=1 Tax=Kazachstania africana (strain ATCC 22294 / BCRC 22015 / CBS 2517 / CECT 1963 / NBRC 1671 / NRRL Y-8276) TaxID=1071382 RepID=H2ARH5_KAZAF|nr:hypothetical protein KAFR_0B06780 [Kazachstania africana CBS 2517]CCF56975.1 hypothetical protein KAFR_0B06780 [Kazachstania africana CBS 2517]